MNLSQKNVPGLAFVGVLLLIVFGIMIWNDRPVQSPRPYDMPYTKPLDRQLTAHSYESWPWEDPFGFKPDEVSERDLYQIQTNKVPNFLNPDKIDQQQNFQVRLHKGLDLHDIEDEKEDHESLCSERMDEILKKLKKGEKIEMLISVVKVYPRTVENKENRTRKRYAVHAGLSESGYTASNPYRLNFCYSPNNPESALSKQVKKYNVRWEYFTHDAKPHVITVWITHDSEIESFVTNFGKLSYKLLHPHSDSRGTPQKNAEVRELYLYIYDFDNVLEINPEEPNVLQPFIFESKHDKHVEQLAEKITNELELRRINKPSDIAIIAEQNYKVANDFIEKIKSTIQGDGEINQFLYFKGLDANQQNIKKRDLPDNQVNIRDWGDYFSLNAHQNPAVGHAQFDYLTRLAHQIKAHNKLSIADSEKSSIKAVGIFGSNFYDKLIILEVMRRENPHLLYFTTELDAQMMQPEYWHWTRNLIVASYFGLHLQEGLQKQTPPFRDSRQTEVYSHLLEHFGNNTGIKNSRLTPQIYEIGKNGPVYLSPLPKNLKQVQHKQLIYYLALALLITTALIFTDYQVRPNSGAQTAWLLVTTIFLFACVYIVAINPLNIIDPFSLTDGISVWPTLLIRLFVIFLVVAFIIKIIRTLEVSFDRYTRKEFTNYQYVPASKVNNLMNAEATPITLQIPLFKDNSRLPEEDIICVTYKSDFYTERVTTTIQVILFFTLFLFIGIWGYSLSLNNSNLSVYAPFIIPFSLLLLYYFLWMKESLDLCNTQDTNISICCLCKPGWQKIIILIMVLLAAFLVLMALSSISHPENPNYFLVFSFLSFICLASVTKSIQVWIQEDSNRFNPNHRKTIKNNKLWQEYRQHGVLEQRLLRTTIMWLIFMNIGIFLNYIFPESVSPCRGELFCTTWDFVAVFSSAVVIFLIMFVLDAQRLCLHWIEKVRTKHPLLVDKTTLEEDRKILEKQLDEQGSDLKRKALAETKIAIDYCESKNNYVKESLEKLVILIAKRTRHVDQLIYYPIIALMLVLFARIKYFDNLDFSVSVGITYIISISLLFYAGLKLRSEASQLKRKVIDRIESDGMCPKDDKKELIEKIKEINYGAFQPMTEQPVVRSALLLLGSLGLFAMEYLMLFGY